MACTPPATPTPQPCTPPGHACPTPGMHAPLATQPLAMHTPLPHMPPGHAPPPLGTHTPGHTHPPWACTPPRHACPPAMHAPLAMHTPLWTEFLTHASENITLPQTSFAGGKYSAQYKTKSQEPHPQLSFLYEEAQFLSDNTNFNLLK